MLEHRYESPWRVAGSLLKGKSLCRSLFNLAIEGFEVGGTIVDIGGKDGKSSYYDYLRMREGSRIINTDLMPGKNTVQLDVEKPFPFEDGEIDFFLAFHLFEHVLNHRVAPGEMFRSLRSGGQALVAVPFIHEYHADPDDYIRLTDSSLRAQWEQAGFRTKKIVAIGEGPMTFAATKVASFSLPRSLKSIGAAAAYLMTTPVDRLVNKRPPIKGKTVAQLFAMDFLAVFEKP